MTAGRRVLVCLFMIGFCTLIAADVSQAAVKKNKLTLEQKKQLKKLILQFRKASEDPKQRDTIVDQVVELGPLAAAKILREINKELRPQLVSYRKEFLLAIAANVSGRLELSAAEIQKLRKQVLALKEIENLTKKQIVEIGDPAMEKLRSALLVDFKKMTAKDFLLKQSRKKVMTVGKYAEKCLICLAKEDKRTDSEAPNFDQYLTDLETTTTVFLMLPNEKDKAVLKKNAILAKKLDPDEAEAIEACNMTRLLLGLNALLIDLKLSNAGRGHSKDMKRLNFFAHESKVSGKKTPWDRAKLAGTVASGENIAYGARNGTMANRMWWHSPGHHKNMLAAHKRIGMGKEVTHYTEMFGR